MSQILVVDDDPDILRILTAAFECAGHDVLATLDADAVQPILGEQRFDAVVLDVMLPRRSGWEVLADLRRDPRTEHLPVMMLSAIGDTANRVRGIRLGADDFLAKPFDPEELIARVEGLLDRRAAPAQGLQGDLATIPAGELLQTLQANAASGVLEVATEHGNGSLHLSRGHCTAAELAGLSGVEAVLSLLASRSGSFRLRARAAAAPGGEVLLPPISSLMLEAAWIEDELRLRREQLPPADRPLDLLSAQPDLPPVLGLPELPVVEIAAALAARPGMSLTELLARRFAASDRVRLAVAWLVQGGVVREAETVRAGRDDRELDLLLTELAQESALRGLPADPVEIAVILDAGDRREALRGLLKLPASTGGAPSEAVALCRPDGGLRLILRSWTACPPDPAWLRRASALVVWRGSAPADETVWAAAEREVDPRAYRLAIAPGGGPPMPDRRMRVLRREPAGPAALLDAILSPLSEIG